MAALFRRAKGNLNNDFLRVIELLCEEVKRNTTDYETIEILLAWVDFRPIWSEISSKGCKEESPF